MKKGDYFFKNLIAKNSILRKTNFFELSSQKILIAGYGKTGKSLVNFCQEKDFSFLIFDDFHEGAVSNVEDINFSTIGFCVVSPGFKITHPLISKLIYLNIPIFSEIEFASYFIKAKIIGITGTNGKTTTSSILRDVLSVKYNVHLAGNIGIPLISLVDKISSRDLVVLEVSSAQLEFTDKLHFYISVILNISDDHLDRYSNIEEYFLFKCKILNNSSFKILGFDSKSFEAYSNHGFLCFSEVDKSLVSKISYCNNKFTLLENNRLKNIDISSLEVISPALLNSISLSLLISSLLEISFDGALKKIVNFKPLEHRIEKVLIKNNIIFYNDSKSTNPDATRFAIDLFPANQLILIVGGHDYKKMGYDKLAICIKKANLKKVIVLGLESKSLEDSFLKFNIDFQVAGDLDESIEIAWKNSVSGDGILFSPGCNGRDMFTGHKQRGFLFKQKIKEKYGK